MSKLCPVCHNANLYRSVRRPSIPVLQNVSYATREAAIAAPKADFELGTCRACGFSFNAEFRAELVVYDANYDNHVASAYFSKYYHSLATMLIDKLNLVDGTVYDVGCGKGEFLRVLCKLAPGICGVGIDPSCTPVREDNFELIQAPFDSSLFHDDARLVILRHVLEHIAEPVDFLSALHTAMPAAPLFVEVPDLDWMLANNAFWDFCYEHCNYFTPASLAVALSRASFDIIDQQLCFGDQYQWALAMPAAAVTASRGNPERAIVSMQDYLAAETTGVERLVTLAEAAGGVTLWGMATKGVLVASLLGAERILGGIDMNPTKQGRFAAGSGVAIHTSDWITSLPTGSQIWVMNPNYLSEIRTMVSGISKNVQVDGI